MPKNTDPKPVTVEQLDSVIDSLSWSISRNTNEGQNLTPYEKDVAVLARNECKHFRDILLGKAHDGERKK